MPTAHYNAGHSGHRETQSTPRNARLAFLLAASTGALTAVSAPITTNAPIVVTASRANRTAVEMPANVTVITADALRDSGALNVVSALETLGGVYFRHNSDNPGPCSFPREFLFSPSSAQLPLLYLRALCRA